MSIIKELVLELDEMLSKIEALEQCADWADSRISTLGIELAEAESGPSRPNRHKLTNHEVQDIRAAHRGGMKQKDLALNYGVNPATISRIVRGVYH